MIHLDLPLAGPESVGTPSSGFPVSFWDARPLKETTHRPSDLPTYLWTLSDVAAKPEKEGLSPASGLRALEHGTVPSAWQVVSKYF